SLAEANVILSDPANVITGGIAVNAAALTVASAASLNGTGNTSHNNVALTNSALIFSSGNGDTFGTPSDTITLKGTGSQIYSNNNITIASVLQGSGGLTIPTSNVTLSAANTFTGSILVNSGAVLRVTNVNGLQNASGLAVNGQSQFQY